MGYMGKRSQKNYDQTKAVNAREQGCDLPAAPRAMPVKGQTK